jgi:hypothetical protein
MEVGMLWYYGNAEGSLSKRLTEAVAYYREKYGQMPTRGVFHEGVSVENLRAAKGMQLSTGKAVQPDHIWIGIG